MPVLDRITDHEQVLFGSDAASGLRCIIAIHSTVLGPALGGTRMRPYATEEEALADVLALSEGMTWKASCAGLDLGGGKAVIIGDPATTKSDELFRAYGRLVESLGGRYVTACDVGTRPTDLAVVRKETRWATGTPRDQGGAGDSGESTAHGVHLAVRATARAVFGSADLADRHVAVQGLGKVGGRLAQAVLADGGRVTVADVRESALAPFLDHPRADVVSPDELPLVEADILSPNALGGLLTEDLVGRLRVPAVCGGANNQLATPAAGEALHAAGITYAPDYVVNAGGIVQVGDELLPGGYDPERVRTRTARIAETLTAVFTESEQTGRSPAAVADDRARRRVRAAEELDEHWSPPRT